jgi:hypothetical protein
MVRDLVPNRYRVSHNWCDVATNQSGNVHLHMPGSSTGPAGHIHRICMSMG